MSKRTVQSGFDQASGRPGFRIPIEFIFFPGIFLALIWPRYFFISIGGLGVGAYNVLTLLIIGVALALLFQASALRQNLIIGIKYSVFAIFTVILSYAWRIFCDLQGVSPSVGLELSAQDIIYYGGWILIGAVACANLRVRRFLPAFLLMMGVFFFLFGLLEYVTQRPLLEVLGLSRFSAGGKNQLDAIAAASSGGGALRVKSVFAHPIVFGQAMALLTPFAWHLIGRGRKLEKVLALITFPIIVFSIFMCQSRSPIVVLLFVTFAYLVIYNLEFSKGPRLRSLMMFFIIGLVVVPVASNMVVDLAVGQTKEDQGSSLVRVIQFRKAQDAVNERPLVGYGTGTAPTYAGVEGRGNVRTVDSYYLTRLVEGGYIALLFQVVVFLTVGASQAAASVRSRDPWDRGVLAAFASVTGGVAVGLSILSISHLQTFFYFGVGVLVACNGSAKLAKRRAAVSRRLRLVREHL